MTSTRSKDEYMLRISVLSHPDELVGQLVQYLVQKHQGRTTNHTFKAISISISTFRVFTDDCWVKLILDRPIGQRFFDKMVQNYFRSQGALILLSKDNPDSRESARAFYYNFRSINCDPNIPVAFVEIQENPNDIILNEAIQLEQGPPDFYYGIKSDNFKGFRKILLSLITHNLVGMKAAIRQVSV
ncbi:MAG: hypothetical protein ACFFDC_16730 [Promethearchaeota archaeon]